MVRFVTELPRRTLAVFVAVLMLGAPAAAHGDGGAGDCFSDPDRERERDEEIRAFMSKYVVMHIRSDPGGAAVSIGGKPLCRTPCTMVAVPLGQQAFQFRRPGYEDLTLQHLATLDYPPDVSVRLVPTFAEVRITAAHTGLDVLLDGAPLGQTPMTAHLDAGARRLEIRAPCHVSAPVTLAVRAGEPQSVTLEPTLRDADCEATQRLEPGYVRIAPGEFTMGPLDSDGNWDDDLRPHRVRLTHAFAIKQTEVTQAEWQAVMGNNPTRFPKCGKTCPIEAVTWHQAVAYVNALSAKAGLPPCYVIDGPPVAIDKNWNYRTLAFAGVTCLGYRLPTEAEWEYAARAGTLTQTYAGDLNIDVFDIAKHPTLEQIAWYAGNTRYGTAKGCPKSARREKIKRCGPQPVGQKQPNAWGLSDMMGNAAEWVHDWLADYGGDASDPVGPATGHGAVTRGGSWRDEAGAFLRNRDYEHATSDRGNGFRVVRTLP